MFASVRRYRIPTLLFSLCLSAVVLFTGKINYSNASTFSLHLESQKQVMTKDIKALSLTQNVRQTVLDNGLVVLTKEVPTAPVVSVQVWYKVGSRNEAPGVNGIAHQLEHMLFKGTTNRPIQFGRLFSALGSDSNAFTSYDQTAYFGTVERDKLKALLVLEADRMQNSRIESEQLASEKRVVISELQGYENSPNYRLSRTVMRSAFPTQAYGLPVGGTKADVEKFTVEQVRHYYRKYYSPDNAVLIIVGDFQTEPTIAAVKEIFGKVPRQNIETNNGEIKTDTQSKVTVTDRSSEPAKSKILLKEEGSAALAEIVYPLPNINHPDVPALAVADFILSGGRSSRLYQSLVESGLASNFSGSIINLIDGGWYELSVTAAPGQKLPKIDRVLIEAIADLQNSLVNDEEINRAKTQLLANAILQNRDITSQAIQLGSDQTTSGDYRYSDRYLAAVTKVTPADVQRVAQTYFPQTNRIVGFFEPIAQASGVVSEKVSSAHTSETFNLGPPVDPSEVNKYLPAADLNITSPIQGQHSLPQQITLKNGLKVLLLPDSSTPTVSLSGYIHAGSEFDPLTSAGLASLTAENLMSGTQKQDALSIAQSLEDRGINLNFSAYREGVDISGYSLAPELPTLIETLADLLQNANFPKDELEITRQQAISALQEQLDTPMNVAQRAFQQAVYPKTHPFHAFPTEASLMQITREKVQQFYREHYRPDNIVLTLLGDFKPESVRSLLEKNLASWTAKGKLPIPQYPPVSLPATVVRLNPVLPGKTQAVTYLGYKGINRQDPRYYAALVLNQILGGDTLSSRLGTEIRDRQGLTYGIYSYFQAGKNAGPFMIQMQTAPEDTERAIASTVSLLKQLGEQGVTPLEVSSAQKSLISSYNVSLANPDSLANQILMNEVYGLDQSETRTFTDKIQAVTPTQVNQAATELLHPNNLVVVTAGPALTSKK